MLLLLAVAPASAPAPPKLPSIAHLQQTAVEVEVEDGHGSGVILRPGLIVTAAHVVRQASDITVILHDESRHAGRLAWISDSADMAAILTETEPAPTAEIDCRQPVVGEPIMAVGYPGALRGVLSWGHVAALQSSQDDPATVALDLTAYSGSSGGPVFDAQGQLIGIIDSIMAIPTFPTGMPAPVGYAFMVPASTFCDLRF